MRLFAACLAPMLLWSFVAEAQNAQGNTFDLQLLRPAMDGSGYFTVDASQVMGHLDWSIGLTGTYARDVLDLSGAGATFRVSDLVTAQLQGALGLWKRAELGLSLPVHILFGSRGPAYVSPDDPNSSSGLTFGAQMVGDLGVHAKVRLLDTTRHPVGLALLASVYAPTGDAKRFLGEGNVTLRPELVLDEELGRARRVRIALNVGALVRFSRNTFTDPGTTLADPGVNGGNPFCFPAPTLTMAPMTCGTGRSRSLGTQLTYGVGISGAVVPGRFDLLAELYGYADVTGADPDGRHGFPMEWLAGGKVYLASRSYFSFGAGTGIIPDQTGSPSVRAFVGFVFEPKATDRGGGRFAWDEPEPPPLPAPAPPAPAPEPPKHRVAMHHGSLETFENIHFETAKAIIQPVSFPILNVVADTLKANPQIELLEIQGHADERGDDDYNMRLTEARAQAVRSYLVDRGVEPGRLVGHGYGETRPTCREHDEACWSQNRRVEFIIVRQEGAIPGQD
jgi:outer membrane protein OmpA-like peptidoglycan-associated protein